MDMIVDRLSEIELAATRIMDAAALEKKELEEQSREHIQTYDAKIDKETQERLDKLQEKLDAQMSRELSSLQQETEKVIHMIETDYEANHKKLAKEILQKMIKG